MTSVTPFDVVHVEHLRGVRYALAMANRPSQPGVRPAPVIWDSVDCISSLFRRAARGSGALRVRVAARLELRRTERFEGAVAARFDRVLVTSAADRDELLALAKGVDRGVLAGHLEVVPNGVDLEYFSPTGEPRHPATLVMTGKMSYHANATAVVRFVEDVMPRVWATRPGTQLLIVGKDPPREVVRLQDARGGAGRVVVTGTVDDIRPFLRTATLAVAPIRTASAFKTRCSKRSRAARRSWPRRKRRLRLPPPMDGTSWSAGTPVNSPLRSGHSSAMPIADSRSARRDGPTSSGTTAGRPLQAGCRTSTMTPSPERKTGESAVPDRHRRSLLAVIAVSVALRLAAAFYLGNSVAPLPGIFDQVSYHTLAGRVLEGHGFTFGTQWWPATAANEPTAHWSFVYVLWLAGIYGVGGTYPLVARLLQAVAVGVLQPLLTYRVAARVFGARVALVSAAVVACYAYFVYYAAALLTESFYIVAILWSLDRAMALAGAGERTGRQRASLWLQLGVALAAAVLLRQVVLAVVPVILLWAWWNAAAAGRRHAAAGAVAAALIIAAAILPWTVRNYAAFHRFVLLNTNAGFAFFWGNHPIHGTRFVPILPEGTYTRLIPDELHGLDEAGLERELMRRGFTFVLDDPVRYLLLSASRMEEYAKFWPSRDSGRASNYARVLSFGVCLPFMIGGVVLALSQARVGTGPASSHRRAAIWLLLAVAGIYTFVHLLTWTLVRYRLPVDAVLLPFAALSMVHVWNLLPASARARAENRATS